MEYNPCDLRSLAKLLNTEDGSSSDDDIPQCSKLGPGDIKSKSKVKIRVPTEEYEHSVYTKKKIDPKAIWDLSEVEAVPFCDDASYDPRQRPDYDISYRQSVTSEDIFLQMGRKNPSTASCEVMIVSIPMTGEQREDIDLQVTETRLEVRSPLYRLSLALPHPAQPDTSSAEWDTSRATLTVALTLSRDYDFVNF